MITTGNHLRAAREALGWSVYEMADFLRLGGSTEEGGRRIRAMEAGTRPVGSTTAVAVELAVFLHGQGVDARTCKALVNI